MHGLPAHLAVPLATQPVEQRFEIVDLRCGLFTAAHLVLDHIRRSATAQTSVSALFSPALTRDQNWLLLVDVNVSFGNGH